MPSDPASAFFTPEQTAYYGNLVAKFALWCGAWPDPHSTKSEHRQWTARAIVEADAEWICEKVRSLLPRSWQQSRTLVPLVRWERVERPADVPPVQLMVWDFERNRTHWVIKIPPALHVLLRARFYTVDTTAIQDRWIAQFAELMRRDVPFLGDQPQSYAASGPRTMFALHAESAWLSALRKNPIRQKAQGFLEAEWMRVGRQLGVVPHLTQARRVTLPKRFIQRLTTVCTSLVKALVDYRPDFDDVETVAALLLKEEAQPSISEIELRKRIGRSGFPLASDDAANLRQRRLEPLLDDSAVVRWAKLLRFPILTVAEIDRIAKSRPRPFNHRAQKALAQQLTAARLLIDVRTLRNRLSK